VVIHSADYEHALPDAPEPILAANRLTCTPQLIATRLSQYQAASDKFPNAPVHNETELQWFLVSIATHA
jgi:hypothetical protein